MAQAIVDPEDVRSFASALRLFNAEVRDRMTDLRGLFSALGDTWRDQEHVRFAEQFSLTMETLTRFCAVAEEHVPFLVRKAEAAQEYLDRR
jgi:uncharacterized protein YukE